MPEPIPSFFADPAQAPLLLVVDDEKVITDTLVIIARQAGFRADGRYDGDEAVAYCRQYRPDVVISGIKMWRVWGHVAATQILAFHPACKFIFFSGMAKVFDEWGEFLEKLGIRAPLFAKPVHPLDLLLTVQTMLEGRFIPMPIHPPAGAEPLTPDNCFSIRCAVTRH